MSIKPLYSYEADTGLARVYHRTTGAVVCEVTGVSLYVGDLLQRLSEQMYEQGLRAGRNQAFNAMQAFIEDQP